MRRYTPALLLALAAPIPAGADTIDDVVAQVSRELIESHTLALEGVRSSVEEQTAAATYIAGQLTSFGYAVERSPVINGDNLVARRVGREHPETVFVVGAHYDSVPVSPGADDNAAAVGGLLEIARVLDGVDLAATVELIAFADEEAGLQGSRRYAAQARDALREITGMLSLEMIAYTCTTPGCQFVFPDITGCLEVSDTATNVGDFIAAVANRASGPLLYRFTAAAARYVPLLRVETARVADLGSCLPDTRRSDHSPFWDEGYAALMLTDTANFRNPNYHRSTDGVATLDFAFAHRVTQAALAVAVDIAGLASEGPLTPTPSRPPLATPTAPPPGSRVRLYVAGFNVTIIDPATRAVTGAVATGRDGYHVVATPDGLTAYVLSPPNDLDHPNGGVWIIDTVAEAMIGFLPIERAVAMAVNTDGRRLYVTNSGYGPNRSLEVIDTSTNCPIDSLPIPESGYLSAVAVTADGRRAYLADIDRDRLLAVDLACGAVTAIEIGSPFVGDGPADIAIAPDGTVAYVANHQSASVSVVDLATDTLLKNILVHPGPRHTAFSADGEIGLVAACCYGADPRIDVLDPRVQRVAASIRPPDGTYPYRVTFGLDRDTAYATDCSNHLLVVDVAGRSVEETLDQPSCGGAALVIIPAVTPTARMVATCPPSVPTHTRATCVPDPTATPTPIAPSSPSATLSATPQSHACAGDCDGDSAVSIAELVRAVNIALGQDSLTTCRAVDGDANGSVEIGELVAAVRAALSDCGVTVPSGAEGFERTSRLAHGDYPLSR